MIRLSMPCPQREFSLYPECKVYNPVQKEDRTRTAVVTIAMGEPLKWMFDITLPSIEAYAKKYGHDYVLIDDAWRKNNGHPCKYKANVWYLLQMERYDRILYVDSDIFIQDSAPNIFDYVPEGTLGVYEEGWHWNGSPDRFLHNDFIDYVKHYNTLMQSNNDYPVAKEWDGKYYNAGMFVCDKWTCPHIPPAHGIMHIQDRITISEGGDFYDQHYFNLMRIKYDIPVTSLDIKWDFFRTMKNQSLRIEDAYFIHYCAHSKEYLKSDIASGLLTYPSGEPQKKNRIMMYTVVSGSDYEAVFSLIRPYHEAYAAKHDYDYTVIKSSDSNIKNPAWWKLDGKKFFDDYDCIVYLDADAMPWLNAKDIVSVVPKGKFGAFNSYTLNYMQPPSSNVYRSFVDWQKKNGYAHENVNTFYINSGVFVCWKDSAKILDCKYEDVRMYFEQHAINQNLYDNPHLYYEIGREWNCGHLHMYSAKRIGHKSNIIHLNGINVRNRYSFLKSYIEDHKAYQ